VTRAALGLVQLPWQADGLDVALERDPNTGAYCYDEVIWLVGRRAGKTVGAFAPPLLDMFRGPLTLPNGRVKPYRAAHTSQDLTSARRRFFQEVTEPLKDRLTDDAGRSVKVLRNMAATELLIDHTGAGDPTGRYASSLSVFAPTPTSVRSQGLVNVSIDEATSFEEEEGEALTAAARPTIAEMFGHGQLWWMSNVSRTPGSWLAKLVERGRAAALANTGRGTCYLEYSAPDDADPADEAVWAAHHPAFGTTLGVDQLHRDLQIMGPEMFAAEYLNMFPKLAAHIELALDHHQWAAAARPELRIPERPAGLLLAVDSDPERRETVALVGWVDDHGQLRVELAAHWAGPVPDQTVIDWCTAVTTAQDVTAIGYDPITMATVGASLTAAGLPAEPVGGTAATVAYRDLCGRLAAHTLTHRAQPILDRHVHAAVRRAVGADGAYRITRRGTDSVVAGAIAVAMLASLAARDTAAPFVIY
jgi:hypothetical protein